MMYSLKNTLAGLLTATIVLASGGISSAEETHGLSIFGDLKYPPNFGHFDYADPNAPKGGRVTLSAMGTFDSLNPYILKGVSAAGLGLLFDTLMVQSDDEPFSQYGLLAETVELAEDRAWVIFTLRPEARFHDGSPVTAEDVVFSFNTLKEKGHPFYASYYRDISAAETLGERKVKFTFADKTNRELPLIIGQLPVLSKAFYTEHDFEDSALEIPVGSGPYRIESFEPGRTITYRRDSDYWGRNIPANRGQYNIDTITYDYYRDATVAIEALKAREFDFRQENISKNWAKAYASPALEKGLLKKEEIFHERPIGMQGFILNQRRWQYEDPKTRLALSYAFDFEWSNENLFYGAYTRTESYFANSIYAAEGLPTDAELELLDPYRDQLPEEVFTREFEAPRTDGSGNNRENLLKARDLLKEAGWEIREDKKLYHGETGQTFTMEILLHSPSFERVVAPWIRNLKKLGIDARMRMVDSAQYQKRLEEFDYDVIVYLYGQSNSPGNEQIDFWHSSKADVPGSRNYIGIENEAVDAMVQHIVTASSQQELITACRALDRVLLWHHYVVPNWYNDSYRIAYWDKFGRPAILPKYSLRFPSLWWVDAEKEARIEQGLSNLTPEEKAANAANKQTEEKDRTWLYLLLAIGVGIVLWWGTRKGKSS